MYTKRPSLLTLVTQHQPGPPHETENRGVEGIPFEGMNSISMIVAPALGRAVVAKEHHAGVVSVEEH